MQFYFAYDYAVLRFGVYNLLIGQPPSGLVSILGQISSVLKKNAFSINKILSYTFLEQSQSEIINSE